MKSCGFKGALHPNDPSISHLYQNDMQIPCVAFMDPIMDAMGPIVGGSCLPRSCRSKQGQEIFHIPLSSLSKTMGYLISFLLGIFVATVGVSGAASVLDKAVKQSQAYMKELVK